jgi:hypothetical protein
MSLRETDSEDVNRFHPVLVNIVINLPVSKIRETDHFKLDKMGRARSRRERAEEYMGL